MAFENLDVDDGTQDEEGAPPEESSNRTFLIAAGILGAVALMALICIAAYTLIWLPKSQDERRMQLETRSAQNTQVAIVIEFTQTAVSLAQAATPTYTATVPPTATATLTVTPSPTAVLAVPTNTEVPGSPVPPDQAQIDPRTATVAALLTQAAVSTQTVVVPPTSTALPKTGFAEDVGLPAMMALALVLLGVIFAARKLRSA